MRLEARDILQGVGNPIGLGANVLRGGVPSGSGVPNLGKSLNLHQVLPASAQRIGRAVANAPRTDIGKAVLSATGGNPAMIAMGATRLAKSTGKISHFDSRKLMRESLPSALKLAPQHNSLISV
jgi:hypothetical protein